MSQWSEVPAKISPIEFRLLIDIVSRRAPDFLEIVQSEGIITPGSRARLEDLIDEEAVGAMSKDWEPTRHSMAAEELNRKLNLLFPPSPEKLVTWGRAPGDPIRRGVDRYEEVCDDVSEPS